MIVRAWKDLQPGDVVLGRNGGTVRTLDPGATEGTLLVRYEDETARAVRDPDEETVIRDPSGEDPPA